MKSDGTRFGSSVRVLSLFLLSIASLPTRSVELARESNFEIGAQSLSSALIQFSQQANLQIVTSGRGIAGAASHGAKGRFTIAAALDQLLAGTGFTYQTIGDGTISVMTIDAAKKQENAASSKDREANGPKRASANTLERSRPLLGSGATSEVVVTGTRVADRTIAESLSPIDVVSTNSLSSAGTPEINQQLSRLLPSFNFPRPSMTDGTDHVRPAQLRGLSPDQTLVLINGKRRQTSAIVNLNGSIGRGSAPVDLNALPMSAMQRVEVLRDGASAQYGSDAIAGVINMILREDRSGGSVDLRYGQFEKGDGALTQASGWVGLPLASEGFLTLSAEYRKRDATDRSGNDPRQMYPALRDGALDPRESSFNRNVFQYGDPKTDDRIVFVNGGLPFGNDKELYFFANYSDRNGESPGFFRRPLEARNVLAIYPDGFLPYITSHVDDAEVVTGVRGAFGEWLWDASVNYGGNRFRFGVENSLNWSLGAASPSRFYNGTLDNDQAIGNLDLVRSLDIAGLHAPVNLAVGAEYRRESYRIRPGEPNSYFGAGSEVFPGFKPEDAVDAGRQSRAAYGEAETLLTDKLSLSAAVRVENYSDFGSATSTKLATRYALTPRFALRATASNGFRAPSLPQQYYSTTARFYPNRGGGSPVDIHTFCSDDPIARALGAEPLGPEKSRNYTIGAVAQPVENLYFTLDLYDIDIDDRIVLSENLTGTDIQRFLADNGFPFTDGGRYFTNAVDTTTRGVDVLGRYTGSLDSGGKFALTLAYNWNKTQIDRVAPPPQVLIDNGFTFERVGRQERGRITDGSPRDKLVLGADFAIRALEMHVNGTRYGKWVDVASTPALAQSFGSEVVLDVSASYQLQQRVFMTVGADNVTDAYPDELRTGNNFNGILPYSPMSPFGFNGAFYYLKLRYDFAL